jgi:hypothetical protein
VWHRGGLKLATVLDILVGLSWLVNLVLDVGAAYYCYRLTRITGGFRAWWLLIAFTVLFTVQSFFGVPYQIITSTGLLAGSTETALVGTALLTVALGLAMSLLLFLAMFEIFRTFKRLQTGSTNKGLD